MAISDALFTSVSKANPSNSQTKSVEPADQTTASEFLTVQSLTNFAAMTGALTVAWKALIALSSTSFSTQWTPFFMALAWFVVSLVTTVAQQDSAADRKNVGSWASWTFIGLVNSLVLFAAVIGIK
jgi:hypothetical protein